MASVAFPPFLNPVAVEAWLRRLFDLRGNLELSPITLVSLGMGTELLRDLSPAFTSHGLIAKDPDGKVLLIDAWSEPDDILVAPLPVTSTLHELSLVEAYLDLRPGSPLGRGLLEGLASLYALVVYGGIEARLLSFCLPSGSRLGNEPDFEAFSPLYLGCGLDFFSRVTVLCPREKLKEWEVPARDFSLSWCRALG